MYMNIGNAFSLHRQQCRLSSAGYGETKRFLELYLLSQPMDACTAVNLSIPVPCLFCTLQSRGGTPGMS